MYFAKTMTKMCLILTVWPPFLFSHWMTPLFAEKSLTERLLIWSCCPSNPVTSKVECPSPGNKRPNLDQRDNCLLTRCISDINSGHAWLLDFSSSSSWWLQCDGKFLNIFDNIIHKNGELFLHVSFHRVECTGNSGWDSKVVASTCFSGTISDSYILEMNQPKWKRRM